MTAGSTDATPPTTGTTEPERALHESADEPAMDPARQVRDAHISAHLDDIRATVLLHARRLVHFVGAPVAVLIAGLEFRYGRVSPFFIVEMTSVVALAVLLGLPRLSLRAREASLVAGLHVITIAGLLHFGPRIGIGLLLILSSQGATLFFGRRGAFISVASLSGALGATWLLVSLGVLAPFGAAPGHLRGIHAGQYAFLSKPFSPTSLEQAINAAMGSHAQTSASLPRAAGSK